MLTTLYLATLSISHAEQTSSNITTGVHTPIAKDEFEWQFMVDLSLASTPVILKDVEQTQPWDYFQLGLLLDISYKGFFLQTNSRRSSTILGRSELGYQFSVQKDWQLDIILKPYFEGFDPAEIIKDQEEDIPQLAGLDERNPTIGIALRYSQYFENAIFYIDIAAASAGEDSQGHNANGLIIDSFYSYLLPYRNWDIYLGAGLTYYDQALIDYYIGVNADEVSASRPLHSADSAFRGQLEVYAQYPLSQSWSFNAGLTQSFYSSNIKHSPLVDKNTLTEFMVGVLYVF
ncbi:MAG: MipA/OmpV family protein [Colwellia sp.]|nr:MipA/OmpV family protein [Colwellia sp.]MCW8866049.1 MipA/OmpV family protein [Colwellia sp.]